MRAHQIMTKDVLTVAPDASILEAARLMLERHISGLPVLDKDEKLIGIVSEGDFIRRAEIGTQRARAGFNFLSDQAAKQMNLFARAAERSKKS